MSCAERKELSEKGELREHTGTKFTLKKYIPRKVFDYKRRYKMVDLTFGGKMIMHMDKIRTNRVCLSLCFMAETIIIAFVLMLS